MVVLAGLDDIGDIGCMDDIDAQTILMVLETYVYIIRQRHVHTPQPSVHKVHLCAEYLDGKHSGHGHQLFSSHSRTWAAQFLTSVALAAKNPSLPHIQTGFLSFIQVFFIMKL